MVGSGAVCHGELALFGTKAKSIKTAKRRGMMSGRALTKQSHREAALVAGHSLNLLVTPLTHHLLPLLFPEFVY